MNFTKNKVRGVVSVTAITVLLALTVPKTELAVLMEQTSPGLLHPDIYKENRDTAPLSVNGKILQRLWIPESGVHSLIVYLRSREALFQPPTLTILEDNNSEPGSALAVVSGQLNNDEEQLSAIYTLDQYTITGEQWIWIQFTQNSSPLAIRFYRNIDEQLYPGGRLIIDDPPRHQEQGVLAFRMMQKTSLWPSPKTAILLTLGAIMALVI
jgi:hypothetical protein